MVFLWYASLVAVVGALFGVVLLGAVVGNSIGHFKKSNMYLALAGTFAVSSTFTTSLLAIVGVGLSDPAWGLVGAFFFLAKVAFLMSMKNLYDSMTEI